MAFFSEYQFYDSFRIYLNTVIEFSQTLNSKDLEKIKPSVVLCEHQLSIHQTQPLAVILSGSALYTEKSAVVFESAVDLPEDMQKFILSDPALSEPFDYFDVYEAFNLILDD